MAVNYSPSDPVAGASRATSPTEVERWTDYADTIADVDTRIDTLESNADQVWIPAATFGGNLVGAPTLGHAGAGDGFNRTSVWLMDATTYEVVSANVKVPTGWTSVTVDLAWLNADAGSGDVVWRGQIDAYGDGDNTTSYTSRSDVSATAPAQYVVEVTTLLTAVAVDATKLFQRVSVFRRGGEAGDTLANDAGIVGVRLQKAA